MKRVSSLVLCFLLSLRIGYSQDKITTTGFNYTFILNKISAKIYDGGINYSLSQNINIFKIKNLENLKLYFGIGYQYMKGESVLEHYVATNSSGNGTINYDRFFRTSVNFIHLFLKYESKSLNKKETLFLQIFSLPGIAFMKTSVFYSPEIPFLGYENSTYNSMLFSLGAGANLTRKINLKNNRVLNINYGLTYQLISTRLDSFSPLIGLDYFF